ncbi:MAG: hypothetical protein WBV91_01480, partial [Desulfobacterales bacterium]
VAKPPLKSPAPHAIAAHKPYTNAAASGPGIWQFLPTYPSDYPKDSELDAQCFRLIEKYRHT